MPTQSPIATCLLAATFCAGALLAAPNDSQTFSVSHPIRVPGASLSPGKYSIREVDSLKDRHIMQVQSEDGKVSATFIAISNPAVARASKPGPVMWSGTASKNAFVRGWSFAGEKNVLEFAYPKADAVEIARQDKAQVPAVDPESENMKPAPKATASNADMQVITLWLLSAEKIGPGNEQAAIKAVKYDAGAALAPTERKPVHVAAKLPKTGSNFFLIGLFGLISLTLAGALQLRQRFARATRRG